MHNFTNDQTIRSAHVSIYEYRELGQRWRPLLSLSLSLSLSPVPETESWSGRERFFLPGCPLSGLHLLFRSFPIEAEKAATAKRGRLIWMRDTRRASRSTGSFPFVPIIFDTSESCQPSGQGNDTSRHREFRIWEPENGSCFREPCQRRVGIFKSLRFPRTNLKRNLKQPAYLYFFIFYTRVSNENYRAIRA